MYEGVELLFHSYLTSVIGQLNASATLPHVKSSRYSLDRRLVENQIRFGRFSEDRIVLSLWEIER